MKRKNEKTIPVIEEQARVGKKIVDSGKVYIHKKVREEREEISVPVAHEEIDIKKVAVNKYVDAPPPIRYEGDTTIIPVVKEVLVMEKKLVLVEEVHITKHVVEQTEEHTVPLRKEEVEVEHYTRNPGKHLP
jgi:uncharacterized protein (TIGR02271 family)